MMRRVLFVVVLSGCADEPAVPPADRPYDGPRPSKRSDVDGVSNGSQLVVFGGDDGPIVNQIPQPHFLADTWVWDGTVWTDVTGGEAPSPRGRCAVALDPAGRMLLFGGRFRAGTSGAYTLPRDLWAFDFASRVWTRLHDGSGTAPAGRYSANAAYDAATATFYVYGGNTATGAAAVSPSSELWSFRDGVWTQMTVTGTAPSARAFAAYAYDSQRNRLLVHAGTADYLATPNFDLWALDFGTGAWTRLHAGGGGADSPSRRFSGMLTYDAANDRYLAVGGHESLLMKNDVWAFLPAANTWSLLAAGDTVNTGTPSCAGNPSDIPADYVNQDLEAPQGRQAGILAPFGGAIALFAGESDCSDHLDDLWTFDPITASWSEVIEARSGESCARRADACACLCF